MSASLGLPWNGGCGGRMWNSMSSTSKPGTMWILETEGAMNASRIDLMIVSVGEVRPVEEVVMIVTGFSVVNPQAHEILAVQIIWSCVKIVRLLQVDRVVGDGCEVHCLHRHNPIEAAGAGESRERCEPWIAGESRDRHAGGDDLQLRRGVAPQSPSLCAKKVHRVSRPTTAFPLPYDGPIPTDKPM